LVGRIGLDEAVVDRFFDSCLGDEEEDDQSY